MKQEGSEIEREELRAVQLATLFFYERFKEKPVSHYTHGYFFEWVGRFKDGIEYAKGRMDKESLMAWGRIAKQLRIEE